MGTGRRPKDRLETLYVYECLGPAAPRSLPEIEGFLGLWPEAPCYYLFFDGPVDACLEAWIRDQPGWVWRDLYHLAHAQWQQVAPLGTAVGPFVLARAAGTQAPREGRIPLRLHAGVAFGSGLHPSTRLCLLAVAEFYRRCTRGTAVDFGTGTGILAIACALLGAPRVIAIDCNPLAGHEAKENILLNTLTARVHVIVANSLKPLRTPVDLLVMNLEWPSLQQVLPALEWGKYRHVLVSGLLTAQEPFLRRVVPAGVGEVLRFEESGWLALLLQPGV